MKTFALTRIATAPLLAVALQACLPAVEEGNGAPKETTEVERAQPEASGAAGSGGTLPGDNGPGNGAGGAGGMVAPGGGAANPGAPEVVPPAPMLPAAGGSGGSGGMMPEAAPPSPASDGPLTLSFPQPLQHRLTVGFFHGCVLRRDNTPVCWNEPSAILPSVLAPSERLMHLSSGDVSTCGLREDGSVSCWGDPIGYSDIPPTVRLSYLEMGKDDMACGLQSGELSCWGSAALDLALPSSTTYRVVESGIDFSCGIDRLGNLQCNGEIDGPPTDGPFVALAAGGRHACALREDRTLACWGLGDADDPSDGSDERGQSWGQAIPPPGEFVYVDSGNTYSCALRANGDIACWGEGSIDGGCLNGGRDNCGTLLAPPGPFVELALGSTFGCGLRPDNSVSCWGGGGDGRSTPPPGPL